MSQFISIGSSTVSTFTPAFSAAERSRRSGEKID